MKILSHTQTHFKFEIKAGIHYKHNNEQHIRKRSEVI